ncbi:hypothetical protein ACFQY7_05610 [Actinomadura luteofluorescens]|uniref:Uncharacterized protein n=1 Tax=Actinomadura luteofluorescens TaxID=46163 RepID=A0A7Y9EBF2_9ACTN|nr:hypothetical protein [Actinomadura luteofluorescens]NYD44698.1 hypothetical protein [Actinomadura luteofluorescens]
MSASLADLHSEQAKNQRINVLFAHADGCRRVVDWRLIERMWPI